MDERGCQADGGRPTFFFFLLPLPSVMARTENRNACVEWEWANTKSNGDSEIFCLAVHPGSRYAFEILGFRKPPSTCT